MRRILQSDTSNLFGDKACMQPNYHTDTKKHNLLHTFWSNAMQKIAYLGHKKDFVTFPRKLQHKHPATAFVHKNKVTSDY